MRTLPAIVLIAVTFISCRPSSSHQTIDTTAETDTSAPAGTAAGLDMVREFGLDQSTKIEIERVMPPPAPSRTIDDPRLVAKIVDAARFKLSLGPRSRCMSDYRLTFALKSGKAEQFFVSCGSSRISGNQNAWNGMESALPPRIRELLRLE